MKNDLSIEYAHIYTNNRIGDEQKLSLEILGKVKHDNEGKKLSLVVMVDDYSFPDTSFDYEIFVNWLREEGFSPNVVLKESQLIPVCDQVLDLIQDEDMKDKISEYVRTKKYPCSLFIASWYLLRLGHITHPVFDESMTARGLINILPISFKPFEDKALEIIAATPFSGAVYAIHNSYFEGRLIA